MAFRARNTKRTMHDVMRSQPEALGEKAAAMITADRREDLDGCWVKEFSIEDPIYPILA